ncbi:hypothetical protein Zmor_007174 [Zophobas morio]|uniref:Uncharacterized protein n=1 Tax=Zophobas morio TaxID=2755281 RepID=A0AA38IWX8_9CUCU|nr:hypothetical protein Zmor_007174 [Zophobas morio]
MPQRKKPFSGKAEKEQLKAKKQSKQNAPQGYGARNGNRTVKPSGGDNERVGFIFFTTALLKMEGLIKIATLYSSIKPREINYFNDYVNNIIEKFDLKNLGFFLN